MKIFPVICQKYSNKTSELTQIATAFRNQIDKLFSLHKIPTALFIQQEL